MKTTDLRWNSTNKSEEKNYTVSYLFNIFLQKGCCFQQPSSNQTKNQPNFLFSCFLGVIFQL